MAQHDALGECNLLSLIMQGYFPYQRNREADFQAIKLAITQISLHAPKIYWKLEESELSRLYNDL